MKEYYLIARIVYVDFDMYGTDICKIKVAFSTAQKTMFNAMHSILTKFYSEHDDSDIISIEVLENKLY